MLSIRVTSVRWALGLFLFGVGALMMVAPHQFNSSPFFLLNNQATYWGLAFLLSGQSLIYATILSIKRVLLVFIHLLAAFLMFFLASGFVLTQNWAGGLVFIIFGAGILISSTNQSNEELRNGKSIDLFAVLTALTFIGSTLILLTLYPLSQIRMPFVWFILVSLISALLLLRSQYILSRVNIHQASRTTRWMVWGPYYLVALELFYLLFAASINTTRFWVPALYYGIFGVVLAVYPTLHTNNHQLNPSFLRTRLAVFLSTALTLPLIITVSFISNREEASVKADVLISQQREAVTLARATDFYIQSHQSALSTLASQPGLLIMSPDAQRKLLQNYQSEFKDVAAFSLFAEDGTPIARSDDVESNISAKGYPVYEKAKATGQPSLDVLISPVYDRPVFAMGAPILDENGRFNGLVTTAVPSSIMYQFLVSQSHSNYGVIYIVDETGKVIAHPDTMMVENFSDLSQTAPVAAFLKGQGETGQHTYTEDNVVHLVGFSRLPGLGWGIIFDRPAEYALTTIYAWRDTAFIVALISILIIAGMGILIANVVTIPLESLALASKALAAGEMSVPIPTSKIHEINNLATIFSEMRSQLNYQNRARVKALIDLEKAKAELERRVAERTEELGRANQNLKTELDERKRAELRAEQLAVESWRRAEELEAIFAAMVEAVVLYNEKGEPVRANKAAVEMYGIDPIQLSRQETAHRLKIRSEDGESLSGEGLVSSRALKGKSIVAQRYLLTNASGKEMVVEASGAPIFVDEQLTGVVAVWHDVTDREQLLLQLDAERAKLKAIIDNAPEGIIVIDSEGKVILYNPALERIYQRTISADMFINPDSNLNLYDQNGRAINPASSYIVQSLQAGSFLSNIESYTIRPDSTRRELLSNTAPIVDQQGNITGAMVIIHDVTQLKETETVFRKTMAKVEVQQRLMEHLETERNHIARDLHDGPLQELIGLSFSFSHLASLMEKTSHYPSFEKVQLDLQHQIDDLRHFCTELRPPVLTHFGLEKAIRSHAAAFREKYPEIDIKLSLARDGQSLTENIRSTIFRVYKELVYNTLRHSKATKVFVWFNFDNEKAELEIKDNGCGFTLPENWLDLARHGHFGLVGIRERIMDIGGEMELKSSPESGTAVKVSLPILK